MSKGSIGPKPPLVLSFCVDSSSHQKTTQVITMKKTIALVALSLGTTGAFAQLSPLPPTTGLLEYTFAGNPAPFAPFNIASDATLVIPIINGPTWGFTFNGGGFKTALQNEGGFLRTIFLGESAGWRSDFGFTTTGDFTSPYVGTETLLRSVDLTPASLTPSGDALQFQDTFDIPVPALNAGLELWFSTQDDPTYNPGGYYTLFNSANSVPFNAPGNVKWANNPILVNTAVPIPADTTDGVQDGFMLVPTWLFSIEDLSGLGDNDYSDFIGAVQFLKTDGTPFTPVPEPSTYGLIGAAALLGLVARRRFLAKQKAA